MSRESSRFAANDMMVAVGVGLLLLSLACLGTWPALLRLCTWQNPIEPNVDVSISCFGRTLAKAQHRHPCHVYMDYSLAYTVASILPIIMELIFSNQSKDSAAFIISWLALVAMVGGCLLSVGNLCMHLATAVYGAPLTTVLALQASLTVVLGTSLNYLLEPDKTAYPNRLVVGVVMFLLAIGFASRAQTWYQSSQDETMISLPPSRHQECGAIEIETIPTVIPQQQQHEPLYNDFKASLECSNSTSTAVSDEEHDNRVWIGLCIATLGGVCFGFFSPAFNIAVNDPFGINVEQGGLSVPVANLCFAVAFGVCGIVGNMRLLLTSGNTGTETTWTNCSYTYLTGEPFSSRRLALFAGTLCALGNVLQFQGGHLAGYAASDLVQAFPLVATMWDVKVFGEFRHATAPVLVALLVMYIFYVLGIVFLAMSIAL